ncbi:MAG: hypothetical protein ABI576_20780, partial [Flavobacterium sp.]
MGHIFKNNLTEFYEYILLTPLTKIYSAKKQTPTDEITDFSNLLIDKFAIHSLSFFHLSNGIVELKKSNEKIKMTGFDLFTVNSTFRTIMESYAAFNNIYVEPKSNDEIEFRFLLWKLDGLYDKAKFEINETDFKDAKKILDADKVILAETILKLETCNFFNSLNKIEINKIYKPDNNRVNWRFIINENGIVKPLKIVNLIKHTCKTKAFINNYRYTSTHTHTNYLALEHFKQTRGIPISDNYVNPIIKLAIYITCLI